MSYASALLQGVTPDQQIKHTLEKPKRSPAQVRNKTEINEPTERAQIFSNEVLESNAGKLAGFEARCFLKLAYHSDPATISALGRTCRYLKEKIFNRRIWEILDKRVRYKTETPVFSFAIECGEVDDTDENIENSSIGAVKTVTLSDFQREQRQPQLLQYWLRLVSIAQNKLDNENDASNLDVTLGGGFSLQSKETREKVLRVKDLGRIQSWLDSTVKLLSGENHVEIPYQNGKVTLTRYGRGGVYLLAKIYLKEESEPKKSNIHCYRFLDWAEGLREVVKPFIPLVGRIVVLLRRNAPEKDAQRYIERENTINSILKYNRCNSAIKTIKTMVNSCVIPGTRSILMKKKQEKAKRRHQQEIEDNNIYQLLRNNMPDNWEEAKQEAYESNQEFLKQKEKELEDKRQEREAKRQAELEKKNRKKKEHKSDKPKIKTVTKKKTDNEGFITTYVERVSKGGEILSSTEVVGPTVVNTPPPNEKQKISPSQILESNSFGATRLAGSFDSIEQAQYKRNQRKRKGREIKEEKQKAAKNRLKREKNTGTPDKKKKQSQVSDNKSQNKAKQQPKAKARSSSPPGDKPQSQSTPKKVSKTKKSTPVPKNQEKILKKIIRQTQKKQQIWDHQLFVPVVAAFVILVLAIGAYSLLSNSSTV
jgi:hypothetical protein